MGAVETTVDSVALAQRTWAGFRDLRLAQVVPRQAERLSFGCDPAQHDRKSGHEVDQPREKRAALQEVVVVLDQLLRGLEPLQRLDAPLPLGREPAPDPRSGGESVCGVG